MPISSTRKVASSPTVSSRKPERSYIVGSEGEPFVEMIDTTNNVSVREDLREDKGGNKQAFEKEETPQNKQELTASTTYIPSAIEALTASGVYEDTSHLASNRPSKVGVYDNNQSIIKEDKAERHGHNYLKHFYEKNTPIEEVDEFA